METLAFTYFYRMLKSFHLLFLQSKDLYSNHIPLKQTCYRESIVGFTYSYRDVVSIIGFKLRINETLSIKDYKFEKYRY